MAWEDELEPDWVYEAPFYLVATIAYGVLLTMNPTMRWGGGRAPEPTVPIEFVAAPPPPPAPAVNLAAPPVVGLGHAEPAPHKGPGELKPEKIKAGAQDAPPKPAPKPKPAAVKSTRVKHGATLSKAHPKKKAVVAKAVRTAPKPKAVDAKAVMAASIARRAKVEHQRQVKAAAAAAAALAAQKRAEEARLAAEQRAEAKRVAAEAAREKAAAIAAEKARRAEEARAAAAARAEAARQRAQALAEAKAAKARKKAELSQQLATMNDPDEALAQDADTAQPSTAHAKIKGASNKAGAAAALAAGSPADSDGEMDVTHDEGAALAGQRRAGAAAALADTAESPDPGDAAGSGGSDVLDAKATGGGTGPDGNGVSYSVDGPVGNRRLLRRTIPVSPDWVGTRGLDLTVTVRFQVLPNGHVKPGAVVQKTSGFPEIDSLALQAIRQWIFQAAANANGANVWGRVTFHFTS
ncbi:MAG TPA: TonB family protein [Elusimicrobiota bacterium]|nr:TonB family protein [Elusimicrobiota bacterium]